MNKIRLIFKGVSEIVGNEKIGLLVLVDENNERQISIPCDEDMLYQFSLRLRRNTDSGRRLPEVLWQILLSNDENDNYELLITDIIDGQYRVMLHNRLTLNQLSIRDGDAILLSHISKIPIYIEERLMQLQSTPFKEDARGAIIPLNALSQEMLDSALAKAISEENYEMASHLRDEIRRRNNQQT